MKAKTLTMVATAAHDDEDYELAKLKKSLPNEEENVQFWDQQLRILPIGSDTFREAKELRESYSLKVRALEGQIAERRESLLSSRAFRELPTCKETFLIETDPFEYITPPEFDEALQLVKTSMDAPGAGDLNFVVCTGPMGAGKTRMGSELVKAAQRDDPVWKCGYIASADLLPNYDEKELHNLEACFEVLSSALLVAFMGRGIVGKYKLDREVVFEKVKKDLGSDRILLHIDGFSTNPVAVQMVMRACAHRFVQMSSDGCLKVVLVTTGVRSVMNMNSLPRGIWYGVEYVSLASLPGEDLNRRMSIALLKRIGAREDAFDLILEKCTRLQNLITVCGGFPASLQALGNAIMRLRQDFLKGLVEDGHLDVSVAVQLFAKITTFIETKYSQDRWVDFFLEKDVKPGAETSVRTEQVLNRLVLDALTGSVIHRDEPVSKLHIPKLTYRLVEIGGLISLKATDTAEGLHVTLPVLAIICMNRYLNVVEGDVLENIFRSSSEIHEQLALISLQARLRHFNSRGIKTCTLADLRPGGLFAGEFTDLIINVPKSCNLHNLGRHFEGPFPLSEGIEGTGPAPPWEDGTMLMAAEDQQAVDGVVLLSGKIKKTKYKVLFISQAKWYHPFHPKSDQASTSTIQTGSANKIIKDLSTMKDAVVKSWLGEAGATKEPLFIVYDLFSDRPKGSKMTQEDIEVPPHANCAVIITTNESIGTVVGPVLGIRARLKRVRDDAREDMKIKARKGS